MIMIIRLVSNEGYSFLQMDMKLNINHVFLRLLSKIFQITLVLVCDGSPAEIFMFDI